MIEGIPFLIAMVVFAALGNMYGGWFWWPLAVVCGLIAAYGFFMEWWRNRSNDGWLNRLINRIPWVKVNRIEKDQQKNDEGYCRQQGIPYSKQLYDDHGHELGH